MSKIRDITKFLSLTAAENPTNQPLASTDAALDSAETLALITGGNAITITSGVVNHDDTSSQASVNNSGSNFIQDITLDDYGHVTAITSAAAAGGDPYVNVNSTGTIASATGTDAIAIGEDADAGAGINDIENIAIGRLAQAGMSGGDRSIAIGRSASAPYNNGVAIGYIATTGTSAVAIGDTISTVNQSVSIGAQGGASGNYAVTLGYNNDASFGGISIGYNAGNNQSNNGQYNIAIGYGAIGSSTAVTGDYNLGIGYNAGYGTSSGYENVDLGYNAGSNRTTGYRNVCVGVNAGTNLSQGYGCVLLGGYAYPANATDNNEVVVGYGLTGKGSGSGFYKGFAYNSNNSSTWYTTSDIRVKKNIADYTNGLDKLDLINVKTYNYKSDSEIAIANPELTDSDGNVYENLPQDKTVVGLIAQELETVLPNSVTTRENGFKSMDKDELFWVMLNSIKELKARVEALENA